MKTIFYVSILVLCSMAALAQTVVYDSVTMGAGYANDVYYSLPNDEQGTAPTNNWDLAFHTNLMEVALLANHANGVTVYQTTASIADFETLDTAGFTASMKVYNPYEKWSVGAFNAGADTSITLDYGWGMYSPATHIVTGTRVFLLILDGGATIKKFYVSEKDINGNWHFRISDLNNANDLTRTITVSGYQSKNFVYYDIASDQISDREPVKTSWDLLFTRYVASVGGTYYPVTGVLTNSGVETVRASGVDLNTVQASDYTAADYSTVVSTIGWDWKSYDMSAMQYVMADSLVYFVKSKEGNVYRLRFTGFNSTTGTAAFEKTMVITSVDDVSGNVAALGAYPNPVSGSVNIIVHADQSAPAEVLVCDMSGRVVISEPVAITQGLNTVSLDMFSLASGMYNVVVKVAGESGRVRIVKP